MFITEIQPCKIAFDLLLFCQCLLSSTRADFLHDSMNTQHVLSIPHGMYFINYCSTEFRLPGKFHIQYDTEYHERLIHRPASIYVSKCADSSDLIVAYVNFELLT